MNKATNKVVRTYYLPLSQLKEKKCEACTNELQKLPEKKIAYMKVEY
jgi:hypothetical protein